MNHRRSGKTWRRVWLRIELWGKVVEAYRNSKLIECNILRKLQPSILRQTRISCITFIFMTRRIP
ncbi:hypothetical protein Lalb_Chr19g0128341 [Lupinus albus]|uniref:Uncharacterized protein n=1 Tax=Lupinus albus TaxID=3870 RepID=A0A6A4NNP9_LUPAL|nr:hypothetical protein Lalb_Chr19g0128341 [Lupinus albus]